MQLMPSAVPITKIKSDPTEVLGLVEKGPVMLTTRGNGVAVITSIREWNSMAERLKRLERHARIDAAIRRNDFVDYEYADAG